MNVFHSIKNKITQPHAGAGLKPGFFHFSRHEGDNKKELHLRIEQDGNSILLVNANRIYHFNPSATVMAHMILDNENFETIANKISKIFDIDKNHAMKDIQNFNYQFQPIISPLGDPCPICDLGLETLAPFSQKPSAPYRMDLALTYRCNNDCIHCYNERERAKNELSTEQWKEVLDKVWQIGIPHVVFTGGEPTLREDLPDLIKYAQAVGLVTGVNTNGRRLKDKDYVQRLVTSGLDHIQITMESHNPEIHDEIVQHSGAWSQTTNGIRNALNNKLFVMTNTTLLQNNTKELKQTLEFLGGLGHPTIGLNGLIKSGRGATSLDGLDEKDLPTLLSMAQGITQKQNQRLIWYTPTQYCDFDPVFMGLGVKGCSAALYSMCIEPDGSVLPCQSYYQSLGNFLCNDWESIWHHEIALNLRDRHYILEKCRDCSLLKECGGGCPLTIQKNDINTCEQEMKA